MSVFERFIAFVKSKRGQTLATLGGRGSFTLDVTEDAILYFPTSTGTRRRLVRASLERFFGRYLCTGSLSTADYKDYSRNASYTLALIAEFFHDKSLSEKPPVDKETAAEGVEKELRHWAKTRNRALADACKERDAYTCQACFFDISVGGETVVECHHLVPLGENGPRKTSINELVTLCPTCHRIAHLRNPPYGIPEIARLRGIENQ